VAKRVSLSILSDLTLTAYYNSHGIQVIQALKYAEAGNVEGLTALKNRGVDLSLGDYDRRTPIHIAARYQKAAVLTYLLNLGFNINPRDRWGSTPLNYAPLNSEVYDLLTSRGAKSGEAISPITLIPTLIFEDNDYKMLFAA
jgi:ankyrin repeat protein